MTDKNEVLDLILSQIGVFGKYQIINYILLCIPMVFVGFAAINYVFTAGNLDYRCYIPECDQSPPIYNTPWFSNAIPQWKLGTSSKCTHYAVIKNITSHEQCNILTDIFDNSLEVICDQYVYDTDELTIVNEFDLHCEENEWKLALVGTITNIGSFICMPIIGFLSDRNGRKNLLIISLIGTAIFGLMRSFSVNYFMFNITGFLEAVVRSTVYSTVFILGTEILNPAKRVLGGVIINVAYSVGMGLLGVIAMWIRNFRTLLQIIYVPAFLFITYIWLIPESVRWLLVHRRYTDVIENLLKIARTNGVEISNDLLIPLGVEEMSLDAETLPDDNNPSKISPNNITQQKSEDNLLTAFRSPFIIIRLLNCSFCWFANSLVHFGLTLNSVSLSGNKYVNFLMACFIEVPGSVLCYFVLDRYGRKWSLCSSLILSGVVCLASQIDVHFDEFSLIMILICKCAISFSFTIIHIYVVELFPTSLRHTLITICSMLGRIGFVLAPLTPLLSNIMTQLPFIVFATTSILSGVLVLQFPETLNAKLPDTIEEARILGQQKKK